MNLPRHPSPAGGSSPYRSPDRLIGHHQMPDRAPSGHEMLSWLLRHIRRLGPWSPLGLVLRRIPNRREAGPPDRSAFCDLNVGLCRIGAPRGVADAYALAPGVRRKYRPKDRRMGLPDAWRWLSCARHSAYWRPRAFPHKPASMSPAGNQQVGFTRL